MSGEEMDQGTNGGFLERLSKEMSEAVEGAAKSVVTVSGGRRYPGSGIVYEDGLVMTALRVVGSGEGLHVSDGSGAVSEAKLVGYDYRLGLALVSADGLRSVVQEVPERDAKVGEISLSVGRPGSVRSRFGIVESVESSGRGRTKLLRLDSPPYPGLGGGAVVSASGELIGIVAVSGSRNSTFAVPAVKAWEVASRMKGGASMKRGYLGIYSQPVALPDPQGLGLTQEGGLLISGVVDGTPADEAGIIVGDIIVTLSGQPVSSIEDLMTLLQGDRVGTEVPVKVVRGGDLRELSIGVAERPSSGPPRC